MFSVQVEFWTFFRNCTVAESACRASLELRMANKGHLFSGNTNRVAKEPLALVWQQ